MNETLPIFATGATRCTAKAEASRALHYNAAAPDEMLARQVAALDKARVCHVA